MKRIILLVLGICLVTSVAYAEYVSGHTRRNGTYVQGYNRSDKNDTVRDNYSHAGNTNPYAGGQRGSDYDRKEPSSEYYGTSGEQRRGGYDFRRY